MNFSKYTKRTLIVTLSRVIDFLIVINSFRFFAPLYNNSSFLKNMDILIISLLLLLVIFPSLSVYSSWRGRGLLKLLGAVLAAWSLCIISVTLYLFFLGSEGKGSNLWILGWYLSVLFDLIVYRSIMYGLLTFIRKKGRNSRTLFILGDKNINEIVAKVEASAGLGFRIGGIISLSEECAPDIDSKYNIVNYQDFISNISDYEMDELWISMPLEESDKVKTIMFDTRHVTANIRWIPRTDDWFLINHSEVDLLGYKMFNLSVSPIGETSSLVFKALEDRIVGGLILLLVSPVLIVISAAIKLTSPGPVFFKQQRHGLNNKIFYMYKFRSMKVHTEKDGKVTQATKNDPRITKLGAFLRKSSLDELPQFINVIKGDMSVVGPRPHAVAHNDYYKEHITPYMKRHKVKPGITGWAQINGWRGETDTMYKMEKRVELDIWYINNWNIWLDFKIIFLTVWKGFTGKNAY